MMFRRKMLKHVLPFILSVAMVFDVMPVTALAEEYTDAAPVEEAAAAQSNDAAALSENAGQDEVQPPAEEPAGEAVDNATADNAAAEEAAAADNVAADTAGSTDKTSNENDGNEVQAPEADNGEGEQTPPAAAKKTEIVISNAALEQINSTYNKYKYDRTSEDRDKDTVFVKYGDALTDLTGYLQARVISVKLDGTVSPDLKASLTYAWQKGDGTDLNAAPTEAGDYKYAIKLAATTGEGAYDGNSAVINVKIAKRSLVIGYENAIKAGTKVSELKEKIKNDYTLAKESANWGASATEAIANKADYIKPLDNIKIYAVVEDKELAAEDKLVEGTDYVAKISAELKDAEISKNYSIKNSTETEIVLKVNADLLINTEVTAKATDELADITAPTIYDSKKADVSQITYEEAIKKYGIEIKVLESVADPATGKKKEILTLTKDDNDVAKTKPEIVPVWFDGAKNEICEGDTKEIPGENDTVKEIPAITDAGTYYLAFRYYPQEENANVYREAVTISNYVKVVVERASLTLKPYKTDDKIVYHTGMSDIDVLKYIDYKVLYKDGSEWTSDKFDKDTFWGVSYDDVRYEDYVADDGETYSRIVTDSLQPYAPVFKVERKKRPDASQTAQTPAPKWEDNQGALLDGVQYEYRVVFTGKKAAHKNSGYSDTWIDINGSDANSENKNYAVKIDAETIDTTALTIDVVDSTSVTMDISQIVGDKTEITDDINQLYDNSKFKTKIYDGKKLYDDARVNYKKAVVKAGDTTVAEGSDASITYAWYEIDPASDVEPVEKTENGKTVYDGWKLSSDFFPQDPIYNDGTRSDIPSDAGDYVLKITFSKTAYKTAVKYVYYRIESQLVVVDITNVPKAYKGQYTGEYTSNMWKHENKIYTVPNNDYSNPEAVKVDANIFKDEVFPVWFVEKKQAEGQTPGYAEYTDAFDSTTAGDYRLGARFSYYNENYADHINVYKNMKGVEKTDPAIKSPVIDAENSKSNNTPKDITVSDGITLTIELDPAKTLEKEKTYDGKTFEDGWAKLKDALKVTQKAPSGGITEDKVLTREEIDALPMNAYIYVPVEVDGEIQYYNRYSAFDYMKYGGDYNVIVEVEGEKDDKIYASVQSAPITYTIKKAKLTATPVLMTDIAAGTQYYNNAQDYDGKIYDLEKTVFAPVAPATAIPEADKAAFEFKSVYGNYSTRIFGFSAYGGYGYIPDNYFNYGYSKPKAIVKKDGVKISGGIKYGATYTVQLTGTLASPYDRCYDIEYKEITFSATRRGTSRVSPIYDADSTWNNANIQSFVSSLTNVPAGATSAYVSTALSVRYDLPDEKGTKAIVIPTGRIPYIYPGNATRDAYNNPIEEEGNYFAFTITVPYEFYENNSYNGYYNGFAYRQNIEAAGGYVLQDNAKTAGSIVVALPVSESDIKNKTKKPFTIKWEQDYEEKFEVDFTNAVLAVDLTKAVAPKSLAFNGVNTKMAVGSEQQLDVKIKKAQISDIIHIDYRVIKGRDVLSVTTNDGLGVAGYATALKVGEATVAAVPVRIVNGVKTDIPGAKSATVKINVTEVTAPAIKKITPFDTYVKYEYVKPADGYRREVYVLDGKKTADDFEKSIKGLNNGKWWNTFVIAPVYFANESNVLRSLSGLSPEKEYTIYVRNVSAVRTLEDGSIVSFSAKGTAKNFKTSKLHLKRLELWAKDADNPDTMVSSKTVNLTDKTEQLYTHVYFKDKNAAADSKDEVKYILPDKKIDAAQYQVPKLKYWVVSDDESVDVAWIRDFRNYVYISGRNYRKTDLATVDAKGKVTFKGVGTVYVYVKDETTGKAATLALNIRATANSVKSAGAKLAVGRGVYLSSLLTYSEGSTAIKGVDYLNDNIGGTYKPNLTIAAADIDTINDKGDFGISYTNDGDYWIYAKKPGAACSIKLKDGTLETTVNIQSSPIETVKDLKVDNVMDNQFSVSFSYPVDISGFARFRVDITNERKNLVESIYYSPNTLDDSYDGKKKVYTKYISIGSNNAKYALLSKYNVSVTTLLQGTEYASKPAAKSITTTNFPADRGFIGANTAASKSYGGMAITIYGKGGTGEYNQACDVSARKYLTSGNAYTLKANITTPADIRMTDTLTWKSSNTKVATIKANAGTYTAQLNALAPGSTEIEVTSKITKKVIARYPIFVKAVGNAKDYYYGDYEYVGEYTYQYDPYYTSKVELLTLANHVRVLGNELKDEYTGNNNTSNDYRWVKFVVPADGNYTISCSGGSMTAYVKYSNSASASAYYNASISNTGEVKEGTIYYFKVCGSFDMYVSSYTKKSGSIKLGETSINSTRSQKMDFTAAETSVYTFYAEGDIYAVSDVAGDGFTLSYDRKNYDSNKTNVFLKKGETITLTLNSGTYKFTAEKAAAFADGEIQLEADKSKWYVYTAADDGFYTFKTTDATEDVTAQYNANEQISSWNLISAPLVVKDFATPEMQLKKDQTVAFKVSTAAADGAKAKLKVESYKPGPANEGDNPVALTADALKKAYVYQVAADGFYTFSITGATGAIATNYYVSDAESGDWSQEYSVSGKLLKKDQKVMVKISATAAETGVKLNISAEKPVEITADSTPVTLTDAAKEVLYVYTAATAGYYTFKTENASVALKAEYWANYQNYSYSVTQTDTAADPDKDVTISGIKLTKDQKVLLKVSAAAAGTAALKVVRENAQMLTAGSKDTAVSITIPARGYKLVAFTHNTKNEAYYNLHTYGSNANISLSGDLNWNSYNKYAYLYVQANNNGKTYFAKLANSGDSEADIQIWLYDAYAKEEPKPPTETEN